MNKNTRESFEFFTFLNNYSQKICGKFIVLFNQHLHERTKVAKKRGILSLVKRINLRRLMIRSEKCPRKQKYGRQSRPNWKPALY